MAENVIFEQTQLADFNYDDVFGIMTSYRFVDSALEIGKSYIVIWDGVEYPCVGQDMNALEAGAVGLGNLSAMGGEGNDEPFLIGYVDGGMLFGCLDNDAHTVGIYLAEETTATNDVVIQNYSQTEVLYESVPKIWLKSPQSTEEKTVLVPFSYGEAIEDVPITLDFSKGDQRVTVDDGYLAKSAVIEKPVDLVAENIRRGKVIANIEGDFIGDTEEKNIDGDNDLTFADGDFVVNPSSEEKVISKVTISKPSELIPSNVAKGVTIAGVAGTHEGGGGGENIRVEEKDVNFYDYNGNLLHSYTIEEVATLTALPELPEHEGLICQGWNYSLDDVKGATGLMNVGAIYTTDDGTTRVHIEVTSENSVSFTFYWKQTIANGVVVNWGDGSSTTSSSATGSVSMSHAYTSAGNYTVSFAVMDGCTFSLGQGTNSTQFCGNSTYQKNMVKGVNIGDGSVVVSDRAFYTYYALQNISLSRSVKSIGTYAFYDCRSLQSISIPESITTIGTYAFQYCYSLTTVSLSKGITTVGMYLFSNCHSLRNICIPESVTSIANDVFGSCYSIAKISIARSVKSIGSSAFSSMYGCWIYDFSHFTEIPTISSSTFMKNTMLTIKVPSTLLSSWKAATNWSSISSYIVAG